MSDIKNVVISCGSKKQSTATNAYKMYQGNYFRSSLRWALSIAQIDSIYILSAKYGLINATTKISPYDTYMGDKDAVKSNIISNQWDQYKLSHTNTIALLPSLYKKKIASSNNLLKFVDIGQFSGMGYQIQAIDSHFGLLEFSQDNIITSSWLKGFTKTPPHLWLVAQARNKTYSVNDIIHIMSKSGYKKKMIKQQIDRLLSTELVAVISGNFVWVYKG